MCITGGYVTFHRRFGISQGRQPLAVAVALSACRQQGICKSVLADLFYALQGR
ncbi:MAG: hypothetical protein LBU34_05500 [Planctomycetaceae bacterium]|nr:hypothetical protein [Planctomycetaceae bacterium]